MTTKIAARSATVGNWKRRSAIERLCGRGHEAIVEVDGSEIAFKRGDNFDHYLVNTNEFLPLVSEGSVIEVWTSDLDVKPGSVVLVAGGDGLKVAPYKDSLGAQVLGVVGKIETWPGLTVQHYLL
jgi:hypothetical protein